MYFSYREILERGLRHLSGLKKYSLDAQHAPVKFTYMEKMTRDMLALEKRQESSKDVWHDMTQQLSIMAHMLDTDISRNLRYFSKLWGQNDKRLLDLGGHINMKVAYHWENEEIA